MSHECTHAHGPSQVDEQQVDSRPCDETVDVSRRGLFSQSALAAAAMITAPAWLPRMGFARAGAVGRDVLVHVYLRGGADGLSIVPPYGDPEYYLRRPTLSIPQPGQLNGAIPLPGTSLFGLAPSAAPLLAPFTDGKLLIVQAAGLVDPSRSHFDAQRYMELGTTSAYATATRTGWIGRHLQTSAPVGSGLLRGMALQDGLPVALNGAPASLPIKDPDGFVIPGQASTATARRTRLENMYASEAPPLGPAAEASFATIDLLNTVNFVGYVPANSAVYPTSTFGKQMKTTATLIKAGVGLEVVSIDYPNWDLHNQLGPIVGSMATKVSDLTTSLAAFYQDLKGNFLRSVTVVVMSEFGRRAFENASGGTDHGHGNCMFVMGGRIVGGQVLANWPGLGLPQLDNGDLQVTIDHRDILAEIVLKRLGNANLATVFPNYVPTIRGIATL